MKIQKIYPKKSLLLVFITILAIAIFGSVAVLAYQIQTQTGFFESADTKETKKQQEANDTGKKEFIEGTNKDGSAPKDNVETEPTKTDIIITANNEQNGSITIISNLGSLPDGECNLTITHISESITKTAPVIYQPEYSSCAGFTISATEKSQLTVGTWTIVLSAVSNSITYKSELSFEAK
jgi:TPP-dependent trihydroxycyclohexane-1,2-dione (THcHDO) dehydratase